MKKGERLIFPVGIRYPVDGEFPAGYESDKEKIAQANITVGYVETTPDAGKSFTGCFEANVHGTDVWRVFQALVNATFGEVAAPILCVSEDEPILGPYTDRVLAVKAFEEFEYLLANDGMLEFGLIFQHEDVTEELYVTAKKYFKIWTKQPAVVREIFSRFDIPAEESLEFIDDYPHVRVVLMNDKGEPLWPAVVDGLVSAFRRLPPRFPPEQND